MGEAEKVRVRTGAGVKSLRLLGRRGLRFEFEMNMGRPEMAAELFQLPLSTGPRDVTLLWVGNPQCAVPVEDFEFDWRAMGAEIESHPLFPEAHQRLLFQTRGRERHRGAVLRARGGGDHELGTGSTGAAAAAVARWLVYIPCARAHARRPVGSSARRRRLPHWSGGDRGGRRLLRVGRRGGWWRRWSSILGSCSRVWDSS